jgi:hypothetical protein
MAMAGQERSSEKIRNQSKMPQQFKISCGGLLGTTGLNTHFSPGSSSSGSPHAIATRPSGELLKSWGTHMPRSPCYHILGYPLISLSPQAFLATKYGASLAYSIGYHLLTSVLEEYH